MGLTGISATTSVGAITPKEQVMGLTGLSATITLTPPFTIYYGDVDTGSNITYSSIDTGSNTSYSDVA